MADAPETAQSVEVIARLLNLTARRVQQLAKAGHIPRGERGKYELVPTVQGYCRYMQELLAKKAPDDAAQYATRVQQARAEKLERENLEAQGELIPKQDVVASVTGIFTHVRAQLIAIPTKAAPEVVLLETPGEVKDYLTDAVHGALNELAETKVVAISETDLEDAAGGKGGNRKSKRAPRAAKANGKRVGGRRKAAKRGK